MTNNIMDYENRIWSSADILRSSAGLKNSDFPEYMMPFLALRMVESRFLRLMQDIRDNHEISMGFKLSGEDLEGHIYDSIKNSGCYNSYIWEKKKILSDIVQKSNTFDVELRNYLNGFTDEMKSLLGIVNPDKTGNMNLTNIIKSLQSKRVLFGYVSGWANIDLEPFNNSEIITLEEHIKRKWADMSAETAGEQYTPSDVIDLISLLILKMNSHKIEPEHIYKIYDMTCGGGNMLYGIDDKLKSYFPDTTFMTYGQELNGSLYALAKIESMFRQDSKIRLGNTLTEDKFSDEQFNLIVANPPYGVAWTEEKDAIMNDQTERFRAGKPSISDGQLLFVQHAIHHMERNSDVSSAYIVLNGSPMFSGDAGSGESMIRKWILDNDYLEALIQLPTNEFFNTGIQTYIWCLNMKKSSDMKDKIMFINAEDFFVDMKKCLNMKTKTISHEQASEIARIIVDKKESDICKIKDKYDFYYNKQNVQVLQVNDDGLAFQNNGMSFNMKDIKELHISGQSHEKELIITDEIDSNKYELLMSVSKNIEEKNVVIILNNGEEYMYSENDHCIYHKQTNSDFVNVGYGNIVLKPKQKKVKKTSLIEYNVNVTLESVWEKDVEKTPYSPDENINKQLIADYMHQWVSEDDNMYRLLDNCIGVEFNFGDIFPKGIGIRSTKEIMTEIDALDEEMNEIMRLIKE